MNPKRIVLEYLIKALHPLRLSENTEIVRFAIEEENRLLDRLEEHQTISNTRIKSHKKK